MERKDKERFVNEHINNLSIQSKINILSEIRLLVPESIEETTIDNEVALKLDTRQLDDDILDQMISNIKIVIQI